MTLLTNLTNAGLPISYASEDGNEITWITPPLPTDEQMQQCRDIVLQYTDPFAYAELAIERINVQELKDAYIAMIARLEQIENPANTPAFPLNQAGYNQLTSTIRDLAIFEKRIMEYLKGNY